MPLGPRLERSVLATDLAARMLALTASIPLTRDFLSCSCEREVRGGRVSRSSPWRPSARLLHSWSSGTYPNDDEWSPIFIKCYRHGVESPKGRKDRAYRTCSPSQVFQVKRLQYKGDMYSRSLCHGTHASLLCRGDQSETSLAPFRPDHRRTQAWASVIAARAAGANALKTSPYTPRHAHMHVSKVCYGRHSQQRARGTCFAQGQLRCVGLLRPFCVARSGKAPKQYHT